MTKVIFSELVIIYPHQQQFFKVIRRLVVKVTEKTYELFPTAGNILRNPRMGGRVKRCVEEMPFISLETSLQPITRTILRIQLIITPEFKWNNHVWYFAVE